MEIKENGYTFRTKHNEDGNIAHVDGYYARFQQQAPIRSNQDFELDFYGLGASIVLGVTALPRRATPATLAAIQRRNPGTPQGTATTTNATQLVSLPTNPSLPTSPPSNSSPSTVTLTVDPGFHDPFDHDWCDWCLDPPSFPPPNPPGGGGGGDTYHSAVRIQLFILGTNEQVATWELPEGFGSPERQVRYEPQGFPSQDAPVRRTTWWRMVVTPLGPDPVVIHIAAYARIADAPIHTTPLTVRLTNHLFRVGLEALVPQAVVNGDELRLSIGQEIADLAGIVPTVLVKSISPVNSFARLRSLNITTISGQELHTIALEHYRERVVRYYSTEQSEINLSIDQKVHKHYPKQIESLTHVKPDDVCIRIQAAFTNASVSVWGFDVASLRGELGEIIFAFDHGMYTLRPFSFLDVHFTPLATSTELIWQHFTEIPRNVNQYIEDHILEGGIDQYMLKYMKEFLARAVGQNSVVYDFKLQNDAWQIRHSDDPVIPPPDGPVRPPPGGGPIDDGGVVKMIARHNAAFDLEVTDSPATESESVATPVPLATAREFPPNFLTEGEQLKRLDRHKSIVIVMMENRSYDHMLGDLMNARPRTTNAYDGPPNNAKNLSVAGFLHGVPLVHTRDLLIGTAIPVSPRHSFDPVQFQIGDGTEQGRSSGDMLGFARDLYHNTDSPQLACTVYGEEELPVYYKLADEFLTCDRWFAAHPGPTSPNRFATIMGTIPELDNFQNEDPRIGYFKGRNIFDALSEAGIDWRLFESDLSLIRMFDRYRLDDRNVIPLEDKVDGLEATLRKPGPLPRVMFIEPNFVDIPPLKTADDDHPPADLTHGQAFISRVCDLLWDTGRFDEVLLVITYDEHGGFYDHVPPPGTPKGDPNPYPPLIEGGPTWLGVRVPTFVVSPYVSAGATSRTIFDHTSILKTILVHNRAKFSNNVLLSFGERVNQANDLSAVLDLPNPRQSPVPFVRRKTGENSCHPIFGDLVDLKSILEAMPMFRSETSKSVSGVTPRNVTFTERTNPLAQAEERDFHIALTKMFKPRRTL